MQSVWQVGLDPGRTVNRESADTNVGPASLREDYLNQVQRDFLSRSALQTNTPSESALANTGVLYRRVFAGIGQVVDDGLAGFAATGINTRRVQPLAKEVGHQGGLLADDGQPP
jgi:hypothetical protein